jgi:hypothetical protein
MGGLTNNTYVQKFLGGLVFGNYLLQEPGYYPAENKLVLILTNGNNQIYEMTQNKGEPLRFPLNIKTKQAYRANY